MCLWRLCHLNVVWRPVAEERLAVSTQSIHLWKVHLVGYNSVADNRGLYVYLHSFSCYCLNYTRNVAKFQVNLTSQQFKVWLRPVLTGIKLIKMLRIDYGELSSSSWFYLFTGFVFEYAHIYQAIYRISRWQHRTIRPEERNILSILHVTERKENPFMVSPKEKRLHNIQTNVSYDGGNQQSAVECGWYWGDGLWTFHNEHQNCWTLRHCFTGWLGFNGILSTQENLRIKH